MVKKPVKKSKAAFEIIGQVDLQGISSKLKELEKRVGYAEERGYLARVAALQPPAQAEQFCVIARSAKYAAPQGCRTWFWKQEAAEQHAATLLRNHPNIGELLVVSIMAEVKHKTPDIEVNRR